MSTDSRISLFSTILSNTTSNDSKVQPYYTSEPIKIYVNFEGTNYYKFYDDISKNNETTIIYINKSYEFIALNTSHPFYISDTGYEQESEHLEFVGDGSYNNGIVNNQSFIVNFNDLPITSDLYFYCTSHSYMEAKFSDLSISLNIDLNYVKVKAKSYVNYTLNESNVQIFTNGMPNYIPSMFGKDFSISNLSFKDSGDINLEWNSLYKESKLSRDENLEELTFKYCVYTINYPNFDTSDYRILQTNQYGTLSSPISIGVAINGVTFYDSFTPDQHQVYLDTSELQWSENNAHFLLTHIINGSTLYYL